MPNISLYANYQKLKRCLKNNSTTELASLLQSIIPLLHRKYRTIKCANISSHINTLKSQIGDPSIENINTLLLDIKFSSIFKRAIDAVFINSEKQRRIYTKSQKVCESLNYNKHIVLRNTFKGDEIQSWSNPYSKSVGYNQHLKTSTNQNKSQFNLSRDKILKLELALFEQGIGVLESDKLIFFYGKFDRVVGVAHGQSTHYVKMQCNRVTRKKGYRVEIHSYPITYAELMKKLLSFADKDLVENTIINFVF